MFSAARLLARNVGQFSSGRTLKITEVLNTAKSYSPYKRMQLLLGIEPEVDQLIKQLPGGSNMSLMSDYYHQLAKFAFRAGDQDEFVRGRNFLNRAIELGCKDAREDLDQFQRTTTPPSSFQAGRLSLYVLICQFQVNLTLVC